MTHDPTPDDIFDCKQCGDCCTGYGGTYLTPGDIQAISEFIGAESDQFVSLYCQISGRRPVIAMGSNGKCIFFDDVRQCTIHPVKPKMCRAWPFLETILTAPENWDVMAQACPGIKTGFTHDQIKACVKIEVEKLRQMRKGLDD